MDREDLISYLLHRMSPPDRVAFSERWMADPALHAELRNVEAELLDEYARGQGSPARRALVEECLLGTERQQAKLEFARLLDRRFQPTRRLPWRPLAAWAGIAAALVLAAFLGFRAGNRPTVPPVIARPAQAVFAMTLAANDFRGSAPPEAAFAFPPATSVVRLDLQLDPADLNPNTSVEITGPGTAWRQSPVFENRNGQTALASVWVPAPVLRPGRYEVKLSAQGKAIAFYRMTVSSQ